MKIKNFSKSKVSSPLPYLLTLQKENWNWFLSQGLKDIFFEVSPIRDYTKKELEIWFGDYKLDEPKYKNDLEAKINNDSYDASLRVKIKLVNLKTKESQEQEIFLIDIPLMTERGTFVVNGVERVAISQLIRSPGAFFTKGNYGFGAKIIPNRGAWLEIETENSGALMVKIDRKRKVAATVLLRAFLSWDTEQIVKEFSDLMKSSEVNYIEETLKKDICKNPGEALVEIYKRLRPGDLVTPETAKELINNTFFNFERYDLSVVGRWKMRKKIKELSTKDDDKIEKEDRVLDPKDIVAVMREIIKKNIDPQAKADEIDHLGNRRVRTLGEFLQNRLRVGLMRMERNIKDKMSTLELENISPAQLINARPIMTVIREFFTSSQICQFMDNTNPLSELEHKRRLSATGPGGLTRERAGFDVRDVQPSHYGRICPIQTPEGPNIGLINQLAGFAKLNKYGFVETPYFKVENGKITSKMHYLSAFEEENYNIAHAAIKVDDNGNIINKKIEARIKGEPGLIEKEKIDYIDISSEQSISIATSLIPFLQNDDANRALMGSNMQRQSVPLLRPNVPLVCSGVEERVAKDSGQVIVAEESGVVSYVDADCIKINKKTYYLNTFLKTNQYTCFHQKPRVKKGEKVEKGDILTDGGSITDGKLALGQNVLVAFLSWHGCSFEDSIVISEKLVKKDFFTSMHIETLTCDVRETKLGAEMTTCDIPNVSEEKLKDLDEEGIIRIGAEVKQNDILVGKISPKGEATLTAEERLLRAIFGEKAKDIKDTSLFMEHGKEGRVVAIRVFSREEGHKLEAGVIKRIEVDIAQIRKIQVGDKLAGRHGNKGVIGKIVPEEEMPYLEDGTPVEILLNPLSVASRMNIGQILETHLGLAAKSLNYTVVTPSLSGANEFDINDELKKAGFPEDGKITLIDGKTGLPFPEKITVGYTYMMKLIHMVKDKLHMRSIGPYSLITQQPLGGKAQFGGQKFGEMEVWALEGYGAAHTLQEILTIKSDDVQGRVSTYEAILKGEKIKSPNLPASFNLLVNELKSLGFSIEVKEKPKEIK